MILEEILAEVKEEVAEEMALREGVPLEIIAFDQLKNLEELHRIHEIHFMGRTHQAYQDIKCKIIIQQMEIYHSHLRVHNGLHLTLATMYILTVLGYLS